MVSRTTLSNGRQVFNWSRHLVLKALFNPYLALAALWRRLPIGPFGLRLSCEAVTRPEYAYCMYEAALTAERLGIPKITAIEFGVAGGNGLIAMENIADAIEKEVPVRFEIFGFDTGLGLPDPIDYRDLPYNFQKGHFQMEENKLRGALRRAHLVLGDVKDTVPAFFKEYSPPPIAMVSFDLDYYSSTVEGLKILRADHKNLIPRVFCYFDDIVGPDWELYNEWVGELLAIKEFNQQSESQKLAPIHGLRHKRLKQRQWNDQVYVLHNFQHKLYNSYTGRGDEKRLELNA